MKLKILEQRAKAFDYLFDAVVVTDLDGIIIDWNHGSEVLYGYSKQEAIGQLVSLLHVSEDTEHITSEVIAAVEKHGKWTGEVRSLHKDGHIGWIESMCVPIFDGKQMIGALGINRDITERIEEKQRLSHLANYDQLTKIPNRYMLLDRIKHLIAHSIRYETNFALLYIDLDDFKNFNDAKGHAFGDEILKATATRIKNSIRASDTIARIGGDEFVLLLEKTTCKKDILDRVQSLMNVLNESLIIENQSHEISCSVGIAMYPQDGENTDELLASADKSMYMAKSKGNGNFEF